MRTKQKGIILNLVPLLDTQLILIAFLLFTAYLVSTVNHEIWVTPQNQASSSSTPQLELELIASSQSVEISSRSGKIDRKIIPNLPTGQLNIKTLHETLVEIKQKFPKETSILMIPSSSIDYSQLIALMDTTRGNNPAASDLFPKIIFGNLLEESK